MGCYFRLKINESSIVFIGTSSGKTSLNRFHSSLLVKSHSFNLLIDCGDGTSKALLSQGISIDLIDGILFSHLHPDHSTGFPSLIVQMKQLKRVKKLKIFCHKNLAEILRMFLHQTFVFMERSSFEIECFEFEHDEKIDLSRDQKPETIITEAAHIKWESILDYIETNKPEKVYLTHLGDELALELK